MNLIRLAIERPIFMSTLTIIPPLLGFVVGPPEAKRARHGDGPWIATS